MSLNSIQQILEKKWWIENKEMFEDTFKETVKYMKNEKFEYEKKTQKKIEPMESIEEEPKETYASILKK
jgi:hypothetical protein